MSPTPRAVGAPQALNTGEPTLSATGWEVVTLVEGSSFCLSDRSGDVLPGGAHGLFVRDTRVLSRWELRLDGHRPQPLTVLAPDAFAARFVLRRPPLPGLADSTLLLVRERLVGDGLRETITVENLGVEATTCVVTLYIEADFADLFLVKEGRGAGAGADATVTGDELELTSRTDAGRRLRVTASADPLVTPGALSWRIVVPARSRWSTEVVAEPMAGGRWIAPGFRRGEQVDSSAAARKLRAWRQDTTRIDVGDATLARVLQRTATDLGALRVPDPDTGRPFVAAGAPWFMTLFGRDSLLTAWMVLPLDLSLAVGTLHTPRRQPGRAVDPVTEEEPGRILHELRLGPDSDRALGGSRYYGSVDATPLFVMLLAEAWRWGATTRRSSSCCRHADARAGLDRAVRRSRRRRLRRIPARHRPGPGQPGVEGLLRRRHLRRRHARPRRRSRSARCRRYAYAAWLARAELAEARRRGRRRGVPRHGPTGCGRRSSSGSGCPTAGWFALALDGAKRPVDALTSNRVTACGPASPTTSKPRRRHRAAGWRRTWTPVRPAHARRGDGRVQPDELSQRLGLAARQRHRAGGVVALRACRARSSSPTA